MNSLKVAIGSDHAGFRLKQDVAKFLTINNCQFKDFGTYDENSCDYPDIAKKVAKNVLSGEYDRGILICGTGQGMGITANRFPGIRASVCSDTFTAQATRAHNDSNVLCLGTRTLEERIKEEKRLKGMSPEEIADSFEEAALRALEICKTWLETKFEGGRHQKRVDKIED